MRIDAYNKVNQVYQTTTPKKTASTSQTSSSDTFVISQLGKDYQIAKQAVQNAPDVREDRVAQIKSALASGTYKVSTEEVADAMVENYFNASI